MKQFTETQKTVLSQAQFNARQQAGTLEEGQYDIKGTPTTVTVSAQAVSGATTAKSMNVDGTDWNFGGGIDDNEVIVRLASLPTATATSPDFVEVDGIIYAKGSFGYFQIQQPTLTNVTAQETYPMDFVEGETKTLTFFSDANYNMPASVSVTGATSTWNVTNQYGLHGTGTNCYISPTQTQYIGTGETFTFNLSANGTTYKLPETLSIPNATYSRTSDTAGTLTFSGVSADQNFTVVAEAIQTGYTVTLNYYKGVHGAEGKYKVNAGGWINFTQTMAETLTSVQTITLYSPSYGGVKYAYYNIDGGQDVDIADGVEHTLTFSNNATLNVYIDLD